MRRTAAVVASVAFFSLVGCGHSVYAKATPLRDGSWYVEAGNSDDTGELAQLFDSAATEACGGKYTAPDMAVRESPGSTFVYGRGPSAFARHYTRQRLGGHVLCAQGNAQAQPQSPAPRSP